MFSVGWGVADTVPGAFELNGADGATVFGAVSGDDVGAAVERSAGRGFGADGTWETALAADFEEGTEAGWAANEFSERFSGALDEVANGGLCEKVRIVGEISV